MTRLLPVFLALAAMHGVIAKTHMPLPWGKTWGLDAVFRQTIYEKTGASLSLRQRKQWGDKWFLVGSGPISKLEEAVQMAKALTYNTTTITEPP